MSYFGENAHLSHTYSVNLGLFDEKIVISPLLEVLESLGRWQNNRQTCTLKVKKFELIDGNKKINQSSFREGGMIFIPPRDL